ncbi:MULTISPECIES: TonB-dependent siderophore receptor [unclassified Pseudomonas]|uniref:TonB-dependent siderophore receptor n=1 Tax=unclassified Pseudomonas TaxID=196821 RepID=UPI00244B9AE9|nr:MULTISPECIES: TonB-dependent siderophore receptor [unclassified Pseudomonas]MDH0893027.1 TonB-dependent siderophore receptor [Pseudomonas sp. GD03875]MDH1066214.1 TonB-dependent siderophore receptor [Pseudomonas sp. GD03985]
MHRSFAPTALCLALASAGPLAHAQPPAQAVEANQARHYDIAPGPLGQALTRFGEQSGLRLIVPSELLQGLNSPGLQGEHEPGAGLDRLLQGSGLRATLSGDSAVIEPTPAQAGVLELGTTSISGKAPGSTTEGTGSYTTWSTSSSTRLNLSPQDTPQSITVLTRQRMEDQKLDNMIDALNATAGVIVQSYNVGADSPDFMARGSIINNFQIDGVPTASLLSNDLHSTVIYDRVEVVRGATGMMSGLGTPSATVNLIRKRPTHEPQVSLTAEAGSWERYGSGMDVSGSLNESGNIRGRLVADYKHQHAWVDRYEQDYFVLYGTSEFDLSDTTLLTLGFSHLTRDSDSQFRATPLFFSNGQKIDSSANDYKWPKWLYYDQELNNAFVSLEQQFDSGWSGKVELNYTQNEYDALLTNIRGLIDQATGTGATLWPARWLSNAEQIGLDAYATGSFSLLGREHELMTGATLSDLWAKGPSMGLSPSYDRNIPDFHDVGAMPEPDFIDYGNNVRNEHQYSAYVSSRFQLTDSTNLLLGSRVIDWKRVMEYPGVDDVRSRESGVFIPYVGIVQALDDTWSLYASYTKIFQPQEDYVIEYNRAPLEPEEGISYEAGIKASLNDGRLTSSLSVFKNEQENLAVWNSDTFMYDISDSATTKGVELELNGELAEGWQFTSGYAYSVTTDKDDNRILSRLPRHSLKTFTTYRLPGALSRLTVGGGMNWQSRIGNQDQYWQGSYALVNLMARYAITENLSGSVNLNNLFDKEYFTSVSSNYGLHGAPRNVMFSMKYSY